MKRNRQNFRAFLAALCAVGTIIWSFGASAPVFAFGILGSFTGGGTFSVVFDANVASSTVTSTAFVLNGGATAVNSVFSPMEQQTLVFGMASGTLAVGDTVTASSSIQSITNATNTAVTAQYLLPQIKIAEVRAGNSGNALDEYLMLYNGGAPYVASGTIHMHVMRPAGQDTDVPLSFATTTIPSHGFFLIASGNGYSGGIAPDATWSTSTDLFASTSTAVYINATSTSRNTIIDKAEWGASPQIATSTGNFSSFISSVATSTLGGGAVLIRKAQGSSTINTMKSGGADSNKGNLSDSRDNSVDFVLLDPSAGQAAVIKNSQSPQEFPFGGGGTDTTAPVVMGSFPSGAIGEMVPTDLSFIGFGFSKPTDGSTIGTSTVSLVAQGQNTNLCASVTYTNTMQQSGPPGQCVVSAGTLSAGATYVFTIKGASSTPNIKDFSGNSLFQPAGSGQGQHGNTTHDYQITFSPQAGFIMKPQAPPAVLGTYPSNGGNGVPTNLANVFISFSIAISASSVNGITLVSASGGSNILNNASAGFSADGKSVSVPLLSSLTAGTRYVLTVPSSVQSTNGISLPMTFTTLFTAGSGTDSTGPKVIGTLPNIAAGVPVNATDIHISTDDALDMTTVSTSTVWVTDSLGNKVPGSAAYDPLANEIVWTAGNVFQTNTQYTVHTAASGSVSAVKNTVGIALQDTDGTADGDYQFSFTTSPTPDTTGPNILFANANTFSLAVTYNEPVKSPEAATLGNYTLTSGGNPVSLSSFSGNSISYDSAKKTATINGLTLTSGTTFSISVTNVHDLSNNVMQGGAAFSGTTQSSGFNGGQIGVGGGYVIPSGDVPTGFSGSSFGFVPQPEVRPANMLAGFSSNYSISVPITKQIPSGGKIILTFHPSFVLAGAAADSFSPANTDINGPGTGTVTIASVAGNDTAHTVTITLGAATKSQSGDEHDFLHFDLAGIVNSSNPRTPNTSTGYTADIRTVSGTTTLESLTSSPFFIGSTSGGGTLSVSITASGATSGTATLYLFSPITGPITTSTTAFSGGNATGTFVNIPSGTYGLSTDPIVSLTGGTFVGQPSPRPVSVNGTSTTSIVFSATGGLASSLINVHSATAGKKISIFASGPAGFIDIATSTVSGTSTATLYYPADGDYTVGIGPQINKTFTGAPPAPDYVMPKPVQVHVAGGIASQTTVNLDLLAAGNTVSGIVQDTTGKIMANANVYAYSPQGGMGTFGQSGSDGTFSLKVAPGSYQIGASVPGFPSGSEIPVVVDQNGSVFANGSTTATASVILRLSKPGTKISGKVTDGTNAVQGSSVWAFCDPSVTNNSCLGPTGHAEAQTDSSGSYTLYVGNGTWKVGAFIPGYGRQPDVSVTISGADQTLSDFQPSATGTFKSVSGMVCTNTGSTCSAGTAVTGAFVRIEGTDANGNLYSNQAISGNDGTYTFPSVPAGSNTNYVIRGFASQLGEISPTAAFTVNASNITAKDLVLKAGRTVQVSVTNNPSSFNLFMRFLNTTNGSANNITFQSNASGTVLLPNGFTYTTDIQSPGFSLDGSAISVNSGTATYATSTRVLDLSSGNDTVTLTVAFPASTAISGTVKDSNNTLLQSGWVDISDATGGLHAGAQVSASGTYMLALPDGTYNATAYAPGYIPVPKSLSISGGTVTLGTATTSVAAVNLTVNKTSLSISGTVKINGTAATSALVKGSLLGGGTSVVSINADGTYSLPVVTGTWTISAVADGYNSANASGNPVTVENVSVTGTDINLTSQATLGAPALQSIIPSQGGTLKNTSGTLNVTVPANALGSSANTGQVKANETSALLSTASAKPIGTGQDIKAYDSSGNSITTLSNNITVSLNVASSSFSANAITSTSTANKIKLGYFDSSLGDWVSIASTVGYFDINNIPVTPTASLTNVDHLTVSGTTNHLTTFGTIISSDSVSPSAPTGVSASPGQKKVTVSWVAPTTNSDGSALSDLMEYEIYRDTSAGGAFSTQVNSAQVTGTTFIDTSVSAGATYYYKVTATDTSGNESLKSSTSSGATPTPFVAMGGGGTSVYTAPTTSVATSTQTNATSSIPIVPMTSSVTPATNATKIPVSAVFTGTLRLKSKGMAVTRLQKLLAEDKEVYPEGTISGYFGILTQTAVQKFQKKYHIISEGTPETTGFGVVGPKTRAKLMEVFGNTPPASSQAPAFTSSLSPKAKQAIKEEIKILQEKLVVLLSQLAQLLGRQASGNAR